MHFIYKIMVIGDPSVGKTSLIRRFIENRFTDDYITTIGVDWLKKEVLINEMINVSLVVWDVAGQSKYASFQEMYYSGSDFIIIVFDITNERSYQNIKRWLEDVHRILGEEIDFAIFANKVDLEDQRNVSGYEDYKDFPNLFGIVETSAKTGRNVDEVFEKIAEFLVKKGGVVVDEFDDISSQL